jgi:Lrp/AsnC family transcriptional regulator, leucine-responsive regulatory protein
MDEIDRKILALLQENARLSNAELSQKVGLTLSSVHERVKKLERRGVLTGYIARVDPDKLGKALLAFMRLSFDSSPEEPIAAIRANIARLCAEEPDILECHGVAGEDCFVLKIRVAGPAALDDLISRVRGCARSSRSVTNIVLSTYKEGSYLEPAGEEARNDDR